MLLTFAGYDFHITRDYIDRNGRKPSLFELIADEDTGDTEILLMRKWLVVASREYKATTLGKENEQHISITGSSGSPASL